MKKPVPRKPTYAERAQQYARDVVAGRILAGKLLKMAAQRHIDDMQKAQHEDWPYKFSDKAANHVCEFAERLPHVKGEWAQRKEKIVLGDWQCFFLCSLFGWLHKANPRKRRFREAFLFVARKNAKSVMGAIIGLYMWAMDGEAGAEVYSGATTEKQAWEVFRPARLMAERSEWFMKELHALNPKKPEEIVRAKSLVVPEDVSRFEPLIGKPGDGASPSCAIADEFHEHDSSDQVDTMKTGMLARESPILLMITTAGNNTAGPCHDKFISCRKMLEGVFQNEELLAIIYCPDESDDWTDPKVLLKANPNLGVSVDVEALRADQRQAVLNPIDQNRFRTKHLNIWCSAKSPWMPIHAWQLAGDPLLKLDEFKGERAVGIIDLASKDDLACLGILISRKLKGIADPHLYFFAKYYLPEAALETPGPNLSAYRKWHAQGWLTVTEGAEIDFERVEADVQVLKTQLKLYEIGYDPWRATQLAQRLAKEGATVVEIRQTVQNISAPMKETLSLVKAGRLHHDANPVTAWMVSNVVAKADAKDNIYPRKEQPHMKIDGAVTLIMGVARVLANANQSTGLESWLNGGRVAA